jgi:hypothetical protein
MCPPAVFHCGTYRPPVPCYGTSICKLAREHPCDSWPGHISQRLIVRRNLPHTPWMVGETMSIIMSSLWCQAAPRHHPPAFAVADVRRLLRLWRPCRHHQVWAFPQTRTLTCTYANTSICSPRKIRPRPLWARGLDTPNIPTSAGGPFADYSSLCSTGHVAVFDEQMLRREHLGTIAASTNHELQQAPCEPNLPTPIVTVHEDFRRENARPPRRSRKKARR